MARINSSYNHLQGSYLFSEIAKRVTAFSNDFPQAKLIRMGIGDVTRPLPEACLEAMHQAVEEMGSTDTFRGYGPELGYDFLREAVCQYDYAPRGVRIEPDEVFISDGAKCDVGNIQEIFSPDSVIAVTDPVYPVYVDSNVMAGRSGAFNEALGQYENIAYLPCTAENGFVPGLPSRDVDLIYLCYPNNPTGTTLPREELKKWVDYAGETGAVILYDSAYEAYIRDDSVHSIFEIEGAKEVAIEFRSYSKTAGFTGTRCAYTVVPRELIAKDDQVNDACVNALWNRRQSTKFNGCSYITQRGAAAVYTAEGQAQVKETIDYYMGNAAIIRQGLERAGLPVYGGENAPYIWMKTPEGVGSWEMFDRFLKECHIVSTPGAGFGKSGEGYMRLTAFNTRENTAEAMERIEKTFG
ncbi:MAG: LL-diaminopimelate aminotransferase [Christensenellales bacterium]|jgi:LL-diaminopimelate aminotransferase